MPENEPKHDWPRFLSRIGWGLAVVGGLTSFAGNVLSEEGPSSLLTTALVIRGIGMAVMLLAFLTVLASFRVALFKRCWNYMAAHLQFSLKTMMVVMTIIPIALVLLFVVPSWIASLLLVPLNFFIPAALTIAVIYGRDYTRTFCIGALFPATALFVADVIICIVFMFDVRRFSNPRFFDALEDVGGISRTISVVGWMLIPLIGYACVLVRKWTERQGVAEDERNV